MKNLELIKTCSVCPEQYDVLDEKGKYVGYIRFRFGELEVHPIKDNEPDWEVHLLMTIYLELFPMVLEKNG